MRLNEYYNKKINIISWNEKNTLYQKILKNHKKILRIARRSCNDFKNKIEER